ncbi:YoaK family protein [Glacieibacterium sp.]|uniref:YoaK family protein n=1 Tax=Glacieibacterium sp. TaxID=2860237 RepID=UPI003B005F31
MKQFDARWRTLAACMSAVAGFVDAVGFIGTGGFFVSFMSGNSTRMAVAAPMAVMTAAAAAGLIASFVAGVIIGSLLGRTVGRVRRPVVLLLVATIVAMAALMVRIGPMWSVFALAALAMGAENTVFETGGEVRLGVTYMTGALVKTGQHLATALTGGERWGWLPYLGLWSGLVGGAVIGALAYPIFGLEALWIAALALLGLAVVAWRLES